MGKSATKALKPQEIEGFNRQQNRMNNPNVSNAFGSTNTVFGADDQANIVQSLSPEMQAQLGQQMSFLQQGPAQMGEYSNPFIQNQMQGNSDAIARRGGYAPSDASQQGGYSSSNQNFNPQQAELAQALGADPMQPIGLEGGQVGPQPPQGPMPPQGPPEQDTSMPQKIGNMVGGAAQGMGGGGGGMPYAELIQSFMQRNKPSDENQKLNRR